MQAKQDSDGPSTQQQTIRYKILPLFSLNSPNYALPFAYFQIILQVFNFLQVMKFPIDNYTSHWVGSPTAIMSNLDPAYHISKLDETTKVSFIVALTILMNLYYIALVVAYLLGVEYTQGWAGFRKLIFLFYRHIIVPPSFALLVKLLRSCDPDNTVCIANASSALKGVYILSFIILLTFIWLQSYICFDFLPIEKNYTRLRKYAQGPLAFGTFFMLSQVSTAMLTDTAQLIALNTITLLFVIFLFWKDQQIDQTSKLIQLACLWMVMLAYICVDFMALTQATIEIYVYILATVAVVVGVMRLRTYSIKFQLENINKWPTLDIMIRQQSTLRYYLSRGKEYLFKVWIHGYMEIHRQKCDNIACPSRCKLSQYDQKLLSLTDNPKKNQQLIRINNIMKVIFTAGYKLNPVPGQIQLQYTIYLYQRGQFELSLRKLLLIDYSELTFDRYYIYTYLKELLSNQIKNGRGEQFLDMVREMMLKREQQLLLKKFQKAAFLNLQFWSILNQDHPDFQKLNEVAYARLQVSQQISQQFKLITRYAHSQKLTSIYAYYLQHLQNDELMHHDIYQNIIMEYQLNQQILVQDWSNSSVNVVLASLEEATYGKIIEINTSCACLLGYQKHQLANQSLSILYPDDLPIAYQELVHLEANGEPVWLVHKNDYLIQVKKTTKIYNSITTGATALICLELEKTSHSCQMIIDKNSKIVAHSASMIALLGLDLRYYQGETFAFQFFNKNLTTLNQDQAYRGDELIKTDFLEGVRKNTTFSIKKREKYNCFVVQIKCNQLPSTKISKIVKSNSSSFQFRVESTLTEFKYIGCYTNEQSFISQFSQFQQNSLQRAQSQKVNYAKDISTVRLKDNVIQLIQQNQQNESQQFIRHEQHSSHALISLSRKDEQQIFNNKKAYKQFLQKHPIGRSVYILLLLSVFLIFSLYITTFLVERNQASKSYFYASESIYQNLIIAAITEQARYIHDMQLTAINRSITSPATLRQQFNSNLAQLQNIQLLGSDPYPISLTINNSTSTYLTSQYISTLINYAITFSNLLQNANSNQDLQLVLANADGYTLKYLLSAEEVKYQMADAFSQRQQKMIDVISQSIVVQKVMLAMGIILIAAIAVILYACFNHLSKERVRVFEIFLEISEQQLQHFSSKTQKFLVSLHSQEQNGGIEQEFQAGKKTQSSHFAKKKSFKLIKANILYYIKLSIVLLLMISFFIHSFVISLQNSQFHAQAIDYYARTANIKYSLSNTADIMILSALNNVTIDYHQTAVELRVNYRSYYTLHDLTFGTLTNFQTTFQSLLTGNICLGSSTPYGFISIPRSCKIPELSSNGTYLVLSDLLSEIDEGIGILMQQQIHICYQVLGQAQQILSDVLLSAQTDFINFINASLLTALLLWLAISGLAALVIWGRQVRAYLKQLNQIRHILSILPLKLVKQMPLALKYIKTTLQRSNSIL